MYVLKYINYKVFRHFIKQGDADGTAILSAMGGVTLLLSINIVFCLNIYCIYLGTDLRVFLSSYASTSIYYISIVIFIFNYFLIYRNKKYKSIFEEVSYRDSKNVFSDLFFSIYLWGSFVLLSLSFIYFDFKKW
jgi:hypothetical protein